MSSTIYFYAKHPDSPLDISVHSSRQILAQSWAIFFSPFSQYTFYTYASEKWLIYREKVYTTVVVWQWQDKDTLQLTSSQSVLVSIPPFGSLPDLGLWIEYFLCQDTGLTRVRSVRCHKSPSLSVVHIYTHTHILLVYIHIYNAWIYVHCTEYAWPPSVQAFMTISLPWS